ncbi:hypothetical protein DFH27DRAFT_502696 [Peziza echinospora]|nr:hypothetical protein DFH27DRAFT_502696 [Peziza echinospora]
MASSSRSTATTAGTSRTATAPAVEDALIIGVDFGTTFSGVAWCYTGAPEAIRTIKNWPGSDNIREKVPTLLSYSQKEGSSKYKWGAEVSSEDTNQLAWFKLLLDQEQESFGSGLVNRTTGHTRATVQKMPKGKQPIDLVTDFLSRIHKHTMKTIYKSYPLSVTEQFGKEKAIKYCLTVPAVWSDRAKNLTKQAARRAGMNEANSEIRLIGEPEAAAAHCLKSYHGTANCLKVGDIYVIADCGGGTVDLITYEITKTEPVLELRECASGNGGFCGSTSLNRRFEQLVQSRLGKAYVLYYDSLKVRTRWAILNHFDRYLKTSFKDGPAATEDDEIKYFCPLAGERDDIEKGIRGGYLVVSKEEMKNVFIPSFQEIEKLIMEQVASAEKKTNCLVTGVLLVGGFGSSEYLYSYLASRIHSSSGNVIKILQPPDAWTAIVNGAVVDSVAYHNNFHIVTSRIARFSYGLRISLPFIPGYHPERRRFYCKFTGRCLCSHRMEWLVKKGMEIPNQKSMKVEVQRAFKVGKKLKFDHQIYCSKDDSPPAAYEDGNGIELLCSYEVDFGLRSGVDVDYRSTSIRGEAYWAFPFEVCLIRNTEMTFSSEMGGKRLGTITVDYGHEFPME